MIYYKTPEEVELIRQSSLLVSKTIGEIGKNIRPGITTLSLDKIAEEFIRDSGAVPAFKDYRGFPNSVCISLNEAVVHGIPDKTELKEGDIISIDVGVLLNDYYGDSAYTFTIEPVDEAINELIRVTKESLYKAIDQAITGNRLGDIMYAVQEHVEVTHNYFC
ncbi:MAG: M24 family metallopeptidase, partial [Bacteroidetes bacterium]|nr:M24 family metallopeptidase [Bacteroidota bacterium]